MRGSRKALRLRATSNWCARWKRICKRRAGVDAVTVWVGSGVPRFYLPLDQVFPQTNVSQFIRDDRELAGARSVDENAAAELAQAFPEVRSRTKLLPSGPPVPFPVQFRVIGPDRSAAARIGRSGQGAHETASRHEGRERQLE